MSKTPLESFIEYYCKLSWALYENYKNFPKWQRLYYKARLRQLNEQVDDYVDITLMLPEGVALSVKA